MKLINFLCKQICLNKWMLKWVKYEHFQMDLSELDCVYDNNHNIMNDELIKKIY